MATRAIKPKRADTMLTGFQSTPERAPSLVREDRGTITRFLAAVGVLLCAVGALSWLAPVWQFRYLIGPTLGGFCLTIGVGLLLFHAFSDRDVAFRRTYAALGLTLVLIALELRFVPSQRIRAFFLPLGIPGLFLALLFFVGVLRNETENFCRTFLVRLIGGLGMLMLIAAIVFGYRNVDFLEREGILLLFLGTAYFAAFLAFVDSEEMAFGSALGLGLFALLVFAVSLVRSAGPTADYLVPSGFTLMSFAVLWFAIALGVVCDWPFVVLVRRELASYFYSPIAYLVFLGLLLIGWLNYWFLVSLLVPQTDPRAASGLFEPIVRASFFNIVPVIGQVFVVPIVSMRLMSEERRTGTLEVLLTAPVNETTVVLSKFFGALIFYLITWTPYFLFLVALRYMGGQSFEYRPLLCFALALIASGAGFVAMGVFFSTITGNQIIAAVLTFVGMMMHLATYLLKDYLRLPNESTWSEILTYVSFVDLWNSTLQGYLAPRFLVFHLSAAIFFLFLSVKLLEARKWK